MDPSPGKCPVTGASSSNGVSQCPLDTVFGWLREKVAHATKMLPIHNPQDSRKKELMRASITFCNYLIPLIQGLTPSICQRIDRIKGEDTITPLFLSPNQKAEENISHIFTLNLLDASMAGDKDIDTLGISQESSISILLNYQTGLLAIIKTWCNILRAYKEKYKQWPTSDTMKSYREFVVQFTHGMGSSPKFFSESIMRDILGKQAVRINEHGALQITHEGLEALYDQHDSLGRRPAEELREELTGASCPALPKIREIAEACCIVLEECYGHALTK